MNLQDIKSPKDIKGLSIPELEDLAKQMRQAVLYKTSAIGGHVGPNLGDVEIMTAMHYVFDAPKDKIVIDVSHQDFPHKMLTGRAKAFTDPADFEKIGEYTDPRESEYDVFVAGHTSPALSLSTGLAKARMLKGEDYRIIAFVGDGALSGGEAFEGLNAGATIDGNFILILNDNQMAIAPDYGGIYEGLRKLRETNGTADNNLFKAFGWDYVYLADGNDMKKCIETLESVKDSKRPVVVHVNTQKGQGYEPAEKDKEYWHWSVPYVQESGQPKQQSGNPTYASMTADWLLNKCEEIPEFLILSSATPGTFDFTSEARAKAGKHYMDVAIAEQTGVSVMAGAARAGAKVVYPIIASFMQRAYDQLIEDWAMDPSPATLIVMATGMHAMNDMTHLGFWDIPFLTSIPEIVYLAPTNAAEYIAMLEWAVKQNDHKVAVRMPTLAPEGPDGDPVDTDYSDLNKFKINKKGDTVAIIGVGDFYPKAKEVAKLLKEKKGIDATLINPRFISGVDEELLKGLEADHKLVATLEDGSLEGGFGQRVASALGASPMKVLNFGLEKKFVDRFDPAVLEKEYGLTPEQIADKIITNL